ncbi:virulence factor TspB C-terminal domain-related protein [Acinetobacter colistiniresistens]|uniref:virulence factor TspB C-terminal domain-related protein n=1 Tax=Acinetobacter colistiniresistens TaxID=280145 RepID=UPI000DCFDF30|nr:virulence factor TspB C-terminal domain-related protein [Acinetobacter colistiniresistens]
MRFFKYLVFIFFSIISVNAFADWKATSGATIAFGSTPDAACRSLYSTLYPNGSSWVYTGVNENNTICQMRGSNGGAVLGYLSQEQQKCPSRSEMAGMQNTFFDYNTPVPTRTCTPLGDKFCVFESDSADPPITNYPNRQHVVLWSKSTVPATSCTPAFKGVCDKNDPYGGCYSPPNDGCTRQSNGSIVCPNENPPDVKTGCTNNATYCERPAGGCGSNYVPGSFNGKQVCVRKSNTGSDGNDGQNGKDGKDGENGKDGLNGQNGLDGKDGENGKDGLNGQNGLDGKDGENGKDGKDGRDGRDLDPSPIVNAINAMSDRLFGALESLKQKLSQLLENITEKLDTSNGHLEKIEEATTAASEALGTANGHLEKIEEATTAASESLGEIKDSAHAASEALGTANGHLEKIEEATTAASEGIGKTNDKLGEIYDFLSSSEVAQTETEDGKVDVLEREIDTNFDPNILNATDQCPPPMVITFSIVQTYTITFSYENFCYGASLARPWVIFVGMLTAFLIVTGQIRGGSND